MQPIQAGAFSLLPPLLAIVLALLTRRVYASLAAGILAGTLLYALGTARAGGPLAVALAALGAAGRLLAEKLWQNAALLLFLALLGALVALAAEAGGTEAYGAWAAGRVRTPRGAQLATAALGLMLFIDDYFNCLTVGAVMRPVADRHGIPREKLAFVLDATAAPVCILAPISSWAAAVASQLQEAGLPGMPTFLACIPYNLYALLTLGLVAATCLLALDFGPMARQTAAPGPPAASAPAAPKGGKGHPTPGGRARVYDLLLPVGALLGLGVFFLLLLGGFFGGAPLGEALGSAPAGEALALAALGALAAAFLLYVPRGLLSPSGFLSGMARGMRAMAPAFALLALAWAMGAVCRDLLSTGDYVAGLVAASRLPAALLPLLVFLAAGLLSLCMGSSWGTFSMLIPIAAAVCRQAAPHLLTITLAALLAGAVFGDHCSPLSDTTILSAAGAGCGHLAHVYTQLPYACLAAGCCVPGYLAAGFTASLPRTLAASLLPLGAAVLILHRRKKSKTTL